MTTLLLIIALVGVAALAGVVWLFRPGIARDDTPNRHQLIADRVNRPGGDSLDPFADRPDKSHYVDPETDGVVAYRPRFGVALASGGPLPAIRPSALTADHVGPEAQYDEDELERTIAGFMRHCRQHRLRPAVIGYDQAGAAAARRAGLHTIYVGDEALVPTAGFRLDQPSMRNVRQATSRSMNFGVTAEVVREGDLSTELCQALSSLGDDARGPEPERGFSMTHSDVSLGHRPECVIVLCRNADGELIAYQRYAPTQGDRTLSLDVMRRRADSPNGVNERMIVEAVKWSQERGYAYVSLNFATFKTLMDLGQDRNLVQRVEYRLVHLLDRWIKVESLYRFNAKFRPEWLGRYVAFRSYRDLPAVLVAALVAEFGEAGTARFQPRPSLVTSGPARGRRPRVGSTAAVSSMTRTANPTRPNPVDPCGPPL